MKTALITKITTYKDSKGEWRWKAKRKGKIVAAATEGYKRRPSMLRSLESLLNNPYIISVK